MRPDALTVRPLVSHAVLPPDAVAALFGAGARLRETATVVLVRTGREVARVAVEAGPALSVVLDQTDPSDLGTPVQIQGPAGAVGPAQASAVRSRLVLPDGLRRAWGVGETATVGLGAVALAVGVASGSEAAVEIERALWLGAGRPETARWLPGVEWTAQAAEDAPADDRTLVVARRVVTETDVRQARLRRQQIRLGPGQIVTPAARSLAAEWDVFETPS